MKTYGIITPSGGWIVDSSGAIFWTTSAAVAREYLRQIKPRWRTMEIAVACFEDVDQDNTLRESQTAETK